MVGRIYPLVILLLFADVVIKASCTEKGSLTFVIDDTTSMTDDINQIKRSVNRTMRIVFNETASVISNMVLITFNNSDANVKKVANNFDEFNKALKDLKAHSKNSSEHQVLSMEGLILALKKSNPDSHIYVFTDASAKDYNKAYIVKALCQKKQSQISFVFTGHAHKQQFYQDNRTVVYHEIAQACSGLVYVINKTEVAKVLKPIPHIVIDEKVSIYQYTFPGGVSKFNYVQFEVDHLTEYLIVSIVGENVYPYLSSTTWDSNHMIGNKSTIVEMNNCEVFKLIDVHPGKYTFKVKGESETSVLIMGKSDFLFKHGFSEIQPMSLNDTFLQPIAKTKVHLAVLVSDEYQAVKITRVRILGMDKKPLTSDLLLTNISKDFYVTFPFTTPSQRFRVEVIGRVNTTSIKRFAKIPITPLKVPDDQVLDVTINEGKEISLEYNSSLKLSCKVTAFPKPQISWHNNQGQIIDAKTSMTEYPFDYISYLEMPATKENSYICFASNDVGSNKSTINVKVKDIFTVVNTPQRVVLEYGTSGVVKCDIKSSLPMNMRWYRVGEMSGTKKEVADSKDYSISADKTEVTIHKMDSYLTGKYVCQANLINDTDIKKEFSKLVEITGLVVPKVQTQANVTVLKGTTVVLECNVSGVPTPSIEWKYKGDLGSRITVVRSPDGTQSVLRITDANHNDGGQYKCVAQNVVDKDEKVTTLIVQEKPQVAGVDAKNINIGMPVDIECRVIEGWPKPNIKWYADVSGKSFEPIAGTLDVMHIAKAEHKHTGRYKCVVQNEAGTAEHVTSLTVESRPDIVTKSKSVEVIEGDVAIKILCEVVGVPQPVITWTLNNTIIKPNEKYSFNSGSLIIQRPKKTDIGKYTCEAKNYLGSTSATTEVTFEKKPSTLGTIHFVYLLYGENKDIECEAYRSKSQSIVWFENEVRLIKKSIQITKASLSSDGYYTCHVSDKQGHTETHTYIVNVGGPPKLLGDNPLSDWRGKVEEIRSNCDSDAKPQAKVQWKYNGKEVPFSDWHNLGTVYKWGHYTCNVSNPHGSVLKEFDVNSSVCLIPKNTKDVEYMPLILTKYGTWPKWKASKYFFVVDPGEIIMLSCPNRKDARNSFKIFPTKTVIKANCSKEDVFVVDEEKYKISDLQCVEKNYLPNNAERTRISNFFDSYKFCFSLFLFVFYY